MKATSLIGWLVCVASCFFVFFEFSKIWPLASVDLGEPKKKYIEIARAILDEREVDHEGFRPFVSLAVRETPLDIVQSETSLKEARRLAGEPNGLVRYYVRFKKSGTPRILTVVLHPDGEFIGFTQTLEPGGAAENLTENGFRRLAEELIGEHYGMDASLLEESKFDSEIEGKRMNYRVDWRRPFREIPLLDEVFAVAVGGSRVTALGRRIELTETAKLAEKRSLGPGEALGQLGYLLMGAGLLAAYIVFLFQLRKGRVRLRPSLHVSLVMFFMVVISGLLDANSRFLSWDPVWPAVTMWLNLISTQLLLALWALLLGWTLLAAGSHIPGGNEKTKSFWEFASLRWRQKSVGMASLRGGAIGFFCGAIAILTVQLIDTCFGGEVGLQPRAFYLAMLDRQLPALAVLLFFFPIAVVEEAGYRLFAGLWLRKATGSKIAAIVLPALVFGMIHTSLGFLPPEEPWWGRAILMFVVGLIWGWAFFRFDFLTVVLCHFLSDVVIFCWPLLVSAHVPSKMMAALAVSAALWPALFWLTSGKTRKLV